MNIRISGKGFSYNIIAEENECSVIEVSKDQIKTRTGEISIIGYPPKTKGKIIETIEMYDENGKLVERIRREKEPDDSMPCKCNAQGMVKKAIEQAISATDGQKREFFY